MYPAVKKVKPGIDYTLILTFDNGEHKRFDMKPYLNNGIFRELKDVKKFNTVHVSFDTVEWENEADFDPEVLFQDSEIISEGTIAASRKNDEKIPLKKVISNLKKSGKLK